MLNEVNNEKEEKELKIQTKINECIDAYRSFRFNAGAGAGKTYSLVSSLRYVLNSKSILSKNNQKVLCITYTNAAKNEMIERLGTNDQVTISTIHTFIWNLIKNQQLALIACHTQKISEEIEKNEIFLSEEAHFYKGFSEEEQTNFLKMIEQEDFTKTYREIYTLKALPFKTEMEKITEKNFDTRVILGNVSKFQKVVNALNKLKKLNETLSKITAEDSSYKKVRYNSSVNRDILDKMEFSHDTLLQYAKKIIIEFDHHNLFKKMVIDQYPVIFIDECQDSTSEIVSIMAGLDKFANEKKLQLTIGYFGDVIQNIFDKGVGEDIESIHLGLESINKEYNRRSTNEVIQIINRIRGDELEQETIFNDASGGRVEVSIIEESSSEEETIEKIKEDVDIFFKEFENSSTSYNLKKRFGCLVLKHKTLSKIRGFSTLYASVSKMPKFDGANFNLLSTEFLGSNEQELGYFIRFLKNVLKLKIIIKDQEVPVKKILRFFKENDMKTTMTFKEFHELISKLNQISAVTLKEWFDGAIQLANSENRIGNYIKNFFQKQMPESNEENKRIEFQDIEIMAFKYFSFRENIDNDSVDEQLISFFEINLQEFENWYMYTLGELTTEMNYLTYHSAKGLEFDQLLIIYDGQFNNDRYYFQRFLKNLNGAGTMNEKEYKKWKSARNLFYVACSRARINLKLVITATDYEQVKGGLEQIGFVTNPSSI